MPQLAASSARPTEQWDAHTLAQLLLLHTIACVHSRPPVVAHSSQQYVPAAIRLKAVGGAERKIEGLFWAACVCVLGCGSGGIST